MDLGDHGGDPAHVEVLAAGALLARQAFIHVAAHRRLPETHVGDVDGKLPGLLGDADVGMGEDELADVLVQGEAVDAIAGGQDHHGRGPINGVAGGDLPGAGLQEGLRAGLGALAGAAQDGEDGAHRDVDVDIGGAVQGVEGQQVLAAGIGGGNGIDVVHLLGGHGRQVTRPLVGLDEDVVGEHVQLFLGLALDVLAAGATQDAHQGAVVHQVGDDLAGGHHVVEERGEIARGAADPALFLDDELGDGGTVVHILLPNVTYPRPGCGLY